MLFEVVYPVGVVHFFYLQSDLYLLLDLTLRFLILHILYLIPGIKNIAIIVTDLNQICKFQILKLLILTFKPLKMLINTLILRLFLQVLYVNQSLFLHCFLLFKTFLFFEFRKSVFYLLLVVVLGDLCDFSLLWFFALSFLTSDFTGFLFGFLSWLRWFRLWGWLIGLLLEFAFKFGV